MIPNNNFNEVVVVSSGKRVNYVLPLCCGALMLILVVSGFITECAGLSHTRHNPEIGLACPSNYWNAAAGVLSVRAILWVIFAVGAFIYWSADLNPMPMASCFVFLCTPLTVSNTVLTAQAWEAVNCTQAMMEHNRDADPLIAAGSSMLMMVDWIMLLLGLGWAVRACCCNPDQSDNCCNPDQSDPCCTDCSGECISYVIGGFTGCVYSISAFVLFVMGLVYAHGKTECPSAFWPFAMAMFFILPCCIGHLLRMTFNEENEAFEKSVKSTGVCILVGALCFFIATIVMAAQALQSDECKSAMGDNSAPLLVVGMVMYAIVGLCMSIACVGRCIGFMSL